MYEGCAVELRMIKAVSAETGLDNIIHKGQIYRYDLEGDDMLLKLNEELPKISLDAKYQCDIHTKKEVLSCSGVIKERYGSENGRMLRFQIENGFYSVLDG